MEKLTDIHCGLLCGENGNVVLLTDKASVSLTDGKIEIIRNFLKAESRVSEAELQIETLDQSEGE